MSNFRRKKQEEHLNPQGVSAYSKFVGILDNDPLEEIFELNMGDFLTEHLINSDLANKIGASVHDKNENLKNQLKELVSIYSIDNTLVLLGFSPNEEHIIYNSIAKTIKTMLSLEYCNIYTAKKYEELKLSGTSLKKQIEVSENVLTSQQDEKTIELNQDGNRILIFPMKNNFECIGAIEVARKEERPLEQTYRELIEITARLFVTSLGLQKLIDEVQKVLGNKVVSTSEMQNLRAQLTIMIGDLGDQQQSFVEKMADAVDIKSKHNSNHSKNTAELAKQLCSHIGLNEKTTDLIYWAGILQNIGQMTLSDELFNKKEKLTKAEWNKLQNHPNAGVTLLMNINFMSEIIPYIHYQKELWNGKGKPEGLEGYSIPFGSRIIALADAYCALREDRAHRKALSKEDALNIIKEESGIKWDPALVDALVEIKTI
ncbi:MAG: HD domain-containing protein [Cyanobacteria bacterium SIG30]|nr:HD domain-containing protein [Cyanobacteria bacterium SIG30]